MKQHSTNSTRCEIAGIIVAALHLGSHNSGCDSTRAIDTTQPRAEALKLL